MANDETPSKIEMRSPEGTYHMVLERDRGKFEAQGYEYSGPWPLPAPKAQAATAAAGDDQAAPRRGSRRSKPPVSPSGPESPSPEGSADSPAAEPSTPAVDAQAFVRPERV